MLKIELREVNLRFLFKSALLAYCLQTPSKSDNAHCYLARTAQPVRACNQLSIGELVGTPGLKLGVPGSTPGGAFYLKKRR